MLGSTRRSLAIPLFLGAAISIPFSEAAAQTKSGLVFNVAISHTNPDLVAYEFRDGEDSQELQFRNVATNQTFGLRRTATTTPSGGFQLPGLGSRTLKAYSGDLDWRPVKGGDVTWFAYVSGEEGGFRVRVNYVGANGTFSGQAPLKLPGDPAASAPRWSPNGKHLAFVSDSGVLFVVSNIDQLLSGKTTGAVTTRISPAGTRVLFPSWSPKGGLIAYQTERTVRGSRRYVIEGLPVNQVTGAVAGAAVTLTNLPLENAYRPSWSADERFIAFYMDRGNSDATRDLDIGVSEILRDANTAKVLGGDVRGRSSRRLAQNVVVNDARGPSWARLEGDAMAGGKKPLDGLVFPSRDATRGNPVMFVTLERWLDGRPEGESNIELSSGWDTRNHKSVAVQEAAQKLRLAYAVSQGGGEELRTRDVPAAWSSAVVLADKAGPCDKCNNGGDKAPVVTGGPESNSVAQSSGGSVFDALPAILQIRQKRVGPALLILGSGAAAGAVMMYGVLAEKTPMAAGGFAAGMTVWAIGLWDGYSHKNAANRVSVGIQPVLTRDGRWTSAPSLALRLPLGH